MSLGIKLVVEPVHILKCVLGDEVTNERAGWDEPRLWRLMHLELDG